MARSFSSYLQRFLNDPFKFLFRLIQYFLDLLLAPTPPPPNAELGRPKIAIIGAGLTGVSSASHCVGHGFDVQIFEAGSRDALGGIWAKVNNTSGLQIHSIMYRFHPSVQWSEGYPNRQKIVSAVEQLWKKVDNITSSWSIESDLFDSMAWRRRRSLTRALRRSTRTTRIDG